LVLRRRYWLYYALQFLSGARRQIFVVFAGFMMVEKFGFEVHQLTALFLINLVINIFVAPLFGHFIAYFGERRALLIEYSGLVCVFFGLWRNIFIRLGGYFRINIVCSGPFIFWIENGS
jgi:MFS family permease